MREILKKSFIFGFVFFFILLFAGLFFYAGQVYYQYTESLNELNKDLESYSIEQQLFLCELELVKQGYTLQE